MREESFGQLGKTKSFRYFSASHWNEIHRVDKFQLQVRQVFAHELRSIHVHLLQEVTMKLTVR